MCRGTLAFLAVAPAVLAGPETARVREIVPNLASAEVAVRNKAQWELLGLIGEAKSEAAAKSIAQDAIREIARTSGRLGIEPQFFVAQQKRVMAVDAREWVDHFLSSPKDIVYLAGTVPKRFEGAACINEIAVPVGNCIARFIQRTEEERLRLRGITTPAGMELVPAGEFVMGASQREVDYCIGQMEGSSGWTQHPEWRTFDIACYRSEIPRRVASTEAFYIDRWETTNEQFRVFCNATGYEPPTMKQFGLDHATGVSFPFLRTFAWRGEPPTCPRGHAQFPFIFATLARGEAFGSWAKKRLPSEVEWEKAARGIDGRVWPWGSLFRKDLAQTPERQGDYDGNTVYLPVESLPEGRSPWGCIQIAGNAWEVTLPAEEPAARHPDGSSVTTTQRGPHGVATLRGGDTAHSVSCGGTNSRTSRRSIMEHDEPITTYATFRLVRGLGESEQKEPTSSEKEDKDAPANSGD